MLLHVCTGMWPCACVCAHMRLTRLMCVSIHFRACVCVRVSDVHTLVSLVCVEMSGVFSLSEVASHKTKSDLWIVIDGVVYDVSKFAKVHPGGSGVLEAFGGKDVTSEFYDFHARDILEKYGPKLRIGLVEGASEDTVDRRMELDLCTPFAESAAFRGWKSPYYTAAHLRVKLAARRVCVELNKMCEGVAEANEDPSAEVFAFLGRTGWLAARMGPSVVPIAKLLVDSGKMSLPGNIAPNEVDYFTRYIANNEFYAGIANGLSDGLCAGLNIGLPPILYFGNSAQKEKFAPPVLLGEKRICLAISEPGGGSDVAGMTTVAVLNEAKTHYIVNGIKKWITGGTAADVFVTAVRTGKPGHGGLSFLVIERGPGLTTSRIKTSYSGSAGTALVIYENVLVPRENLLGVENNAFKMIMANFNHERWLIVHSMLGPMRKIVSDCYKWSMGRKAFGKRLIDQPVIRYKLAEMSAAVESLDAWAESITFQMGKMSFVKQTSELAAPIALLKFQTTRACVMIADHACQIFGGRAVTKTGMGKRVEEFQRGYKIVAIYGGSEEIMADVAVRTSVAHLEALIAKGDKNAIAMSRL